MDRRKASKSETRQLILSAAKKLFLEKGVEQCTMRAIAIEAGVSAASVVVHFKNKIGLLEASLYEDIEHTLSSAMASLPQNVGLPDMLMHIPRVMFFFYDTNRELYRALIRNTVFEPEENNPLLTRQLEQYLAFTSGIIQNEKNLGNTRPEVDVAVAAASLASLYIGALILFYRNPQMTPQEGLDTLAAMTRQYLNGIMIS